MGKARLEAFSDGVIAIIITIMVLELKAPHGDSLSDLLPLIPVALSYVLSFIYVGIYWTNHHHLVHVVKEVNGGILWANLHLLFWMSLIPFVTGWMGENHFRTLPVAAYGVVLLMCALAYLVLVRSLTRHRGHNTELADAIGRTRKELWSLALYVSGIGLCFLNPWLGFATYAGVAIMWCIPDRRIENRIGR